MSGFSLYPLLKFGAMLGFVVCTVLVISLNFSLFKRIFKERTTSMWWLFMVFTFIPFIVMIGIFTLLFDRTSDVNRLIIIKDGKVAFATTKDNSLGSFIAQPQEILYSLLKKSKNNLNMID